MKQVAVVRKMTMQAKGLQGLETHPATIAGVAVEEVVDPQVPQVEGPAAAVVVARHLQGQGPAHRPRQ